MYNLKGVRMRQEIHNIPADVSVNEMEERTVLEFRAKITVSLWAFLKILSQDHGQGQWPAQDTTNTLNNEFTPALSAIQ